MVNIRATLDAARTGGVIGSTTAERLAALAKSLFYAHRTYAAMLDRGAAAGLPVGELAALEAWLDAGRIDQKRADALAMLARIEELLGNDRQAAPVGYSFEHTTLWEAAIAALHQGGAASADPDGEAILPWIMDEIRLDESQDGIRRAALLQLLALDEAERQGLGVAKDEQRQAVSAFRAARSLQRGADLRAWLEAQDLRRPDIDRLAQEGLLLDKIAQLHGHRLAAAAIDQLRLAGGYQQVSTRAHAKRAILAPIEQNRELTDDLAALAWYFNACGASPPEDLDAYARRRGFRDSAEFRRAVVRDHRFRRISDGVSFDG
jgi:hypothetical protein